MAELKFIFSDLLDVHGNVSWEATRDQDSDAGIAYSKLKAVYPQKTKEMLAVASPEMFANEARVRNILGTVKSIKAPTASALYHELQRYVDSKEKIAGTKRKDVEMEFWPLIKVVRISTKADALSTGAVIVDLVRSCPDNSFSSSTWLTRPSLASMTPMPHELRWLTATCRSAQASGL